MRSNRRGEVFLRGVHDRPDDVRARYRVGDLEFEIGIDDFFQVNKYLNEQWVQSIANYLEPRPGDFLLDLFCGSGLITLSLARSLRACVGVEANGNAVRNARLNAERNGIGNVSFFLEDLTRRIDLEDLLPAHEGRLKVVVDPPRTGIASHMIEHIVKLNPQVVVYVSCNSATFARDLRLFRSLGYRVERLAAIDMFPRTHHVETIARIIPEGVYPQGRQGSARLPIDLDRVGFCFYIDNR
jgi:23S rRNA (uracil1939-C5)-methyltransferase